MNRKLIVSLDCSLAKALEIVKETKDIEQVYGYKVGLHLALTFGLIRASNEIKLRAPFKKVIYDHQKGCTDVPHVGKNFADVVKTTRVDEVILFPLTGLVSLENWVRELQKRDVPVIIGGRMTHDGFSKEAGGFITTEDSLKIYQKASELGVDRFVLPPKDSEFHKRFVEVVKSDHLIYSPGFGAQGCEENNFTNYPIVGRSIYNSDNVRQATLEWVEKIC